MILIKMHNYLLGKKTKFYMKNIKELTFVAGVHSLGQQEAAELIFRVLCILDLHQIRSHSEGIVLKISFTLFTTTGEQNKRVTHTLKKPLKINIGLVKNPYPFLIFFLFFFVRHFMSMKVI